MLTAVTRQTYENEIINNGNVTETLLAVTAGNSLERGSIGDCFNLNVNCRYGHLL